MHKAQISEGGENNTNTPSYSILLLTSVPVNPTIQNEKDAFYLSNR